MTETRLKDRQDYETINGKLHMMARPAMRHIAIASNINTLFVNYLKGKTCKSYPEPDVFLDDQNNLIPDVVILCDRSKKSNRGIYGAPDLVVEILSPKTAIKDLTEKKDIYGKAGVREYWIVNPKEQTISVYYLKDNNELALNAIYYNYTQEEIDEMPDDDKNAISKHFKTSLFEDLLINTEDIFYDVE
ncbi:MAG: Uma2 family endonuclease [Clostridiales bacterium]|jgi:Uma2 family endonuclease|nr:Uma2 family endonuclease [Clostridiales bacterium]